MSTRKYYKCEGRIRFLAQALVAIAGMATLCSVLAAYPNEISYFNELSGGPQNGHLHLLHSNLDWGQDHLRVIDWERLHPAAGRYYNLTISSFDPKAIGVRADNLLTPYLCKFLLQEAENHEIFLFVSKQRMLEEANCLSKFDVRVIDTIGMSIVVVGIRAQQPRS